MTKKWKITVLVTGMVIFLFLLAGLALLRYANIIAKAGVEKTLGKDFSIESIDIKWGSVRVKGVAMKNNAGKEVIRIEELMVRAEFMNLFREKYVISSLRLQKPYMYVEVDHKGNLVNPVFSPGEKKYITKGTERGPVKFEKIVVNDGSVDYLDRKTPRVPVLTKVRDIKMEMEHVTFPFTDESTKYSFQARVPAGKGNASVKSDGTVRLASKDAESVSHVRGLDIAHFKPYYDKQGKSVHVKKGFMDLDVRTKIVSHTIHAPGHAVIKGLELETGSGFSDRFMGVSASLVLNFMRKNGDQLPADFIVSGDLDNPKFNVIETFMTKISYGIAGQLGVSVENIGGSIFGAGAEGTKKVGQGIGDGFKKIFK